MAGDVVLGSAYREFAPPAGLRGVVACLWVRAAGEAEQVRVVPDASADVVWTRGRGVTVAGPDTTAKLTTVGRGDVLVGLRFLPGAGGGGLGLPLDELTDLRAGAADVDPAYDVPADAEPLDAIRRLVGVAARRPGDPLVQAAARRVERDPVRDIARDLGVSERQLRRRFHAAAGYGPQTLARILRFRRFVRALDGGAPAGLPALALDAGYADQAHLTRECTRLAGLPPARLMRARAAPPPAAGTAARPTR